jgi:hypothetical protein
MNACWNYLGAESLAEPADARVLGCEPGDVL